MDKLLASKLGKLKIICSLPLFSDSICIKKQSAAEHGYTQIILSMILAPHLQLSSQAQCELIELCIFAEMPKTLLGDPSYHLRKNHPKVKKIYDQVKGKIWQETEATLGIETTRNNELYSLHKLIDAFASKLYIEKECLLGNQYFTTERHHSHYEEMRQHILAGQELQKRHPCNLNVTHSQSSPPQNLIQWKKAVELLDELFTEAQQGLNKEGIAGYSATFIGMMEKLKEHYRYKGWSYHFQESVGEHTFQVVFLCRLLATKLHLPEPQRIQLYHAAALHDLAEAYSSDIIYPIKIREKAVDKIHKEIEHTILARICEQFKLSWPNNKKILAIVDICDRFSSQIYFDRETRSGNTHFNVPNSSMELVRDLYEKEFPILFQELDNLWLEYVRSL